MNYPTKRTVMFASHIQLARWWRYLRSPKTEEEIEVMNHIIKRFKAMGGMTPEVSKKLGWKK